MAARGEKKRERDAESARAGSGSESKRRGEKSGSQPSWELLGRMLAPLFLVASLAGVVLLYRHTFPQLTTEATEEAATAEDVSATATAEEQGYVGVSDPWTMTGAFTVGDSSLDVQIKEFCDAFAGDGSTAAACAQSVYNNILWGSYRERTSEEKPQGDDWVQAAARLYFSTASPEDGISGEGDYYEYAAALGYCLRYYGYSDVLTLPVISFTQDGQAIESAVCMVTNENGSWRICVPAMGTEGWMLDANSYTIAVEDIGQDLTRVNALGLTVIDTSGMYDDGPDEYGTYDEQEYNTGSEEESSEYGDDAYTEADYDTYDGQY